MISIIRTKHLLQENPTRRIACSWFTANPIYCLRSQYIYQHNPPCVFCIPGKEHLIETNEEIGLYFNDCPAKDSAERSICRLQRLYIYIYCTYIYIYICKYIHT